MAKAKFDDNGLITFSEFREFMFNNIVPLEDILDYKGEPILKILPFWRKNDLIPFIQKGKHLKISFAELIWIRILDTLRQFSYPITHTRTVCHYFFKDAYDHDLPKKNMTYNHKLLLKKKLAGTLTDEEILTLAHLENFLQDEVLLYLLKTDINYLTGIVTECISAGEERGILVFQDGRVGETDGTGLITHAEYLIDRTEPHIYLSIPYFLREFIISDQLSKIFLPQVLNDNEKKVLKEIKDKNVSEVIITLKNGDVEKISSTKEGILTASQARQIKEILCLKNYQKITLDTLNDTTLKFKKTHKKI